MGDKAQDVSSFLQELLVEQQRLQTPVALFSEQEPHGGTHGRYKDLIPLTAPGPGEQYAFEVDLDSCTGCKACVAACHSLNGLDDDESWRDIGLLVGKADQPFAQTITTACHHCADPGCMKGCPVLAYEKNPITGIVKHLDDQCIGCSYCILMCPYDVPKYNQARGIVRKCDMCQGRLAAGEAPACAQACPTHAIRIVTVKTEVNAEGRLIADTTCFLEAGPDPELTQPTTRYVSRRGLPADLIAADSASLEPEHAHAPLVVMLSLLQLAIGAEAAAAVIGDGGAALFPSFRSSHSHLAALTPVNALLGIAWVSGLAGLGASFFHLGQPTRAWRVFLGLRQSWMSREIILLSGWYLLASAALVIPGLATAAALAGAAGLFCSVMVYVATGRTSWRAEETATRFFGGAIVLGLAASFAVSDTPRAASVLAAAVAAKLLFEFRVRGRSDGTDAVSTSAKRAERLLSGPLKPLRSARMLLGIAGGILLPLIASGTQLPRPAAWLVLPMVLAAEVLERILFFRSVAPQRMPGIARP